MNNITALGNLASDAELRHIPNGTPVLSFTVANECGYGKKKTVNWLRCSLFGARAEKLAPHFLKGTKLVVTGELTLREWEKDGQKRTSLEVKVNDFAFAGDGRKESAPQQSKPQAAPAAPLPDLDDEIPFDRLKHEYIY